MANRSALRNFIFCLALVSGSFCLAAGNTIQWGVNVHSGGNDPKNVAEKLSERNLKFVRMDLWGNDAKYLAKFRNAAESFQTKNIKIETVVYTIFSGGQPRSQDYDADLKEVEKTAYDTTKSQIEKTKDLVQDFELQNEISLYKGIKIAGSSGQSEEDFDTPAARLQAANLRGMSKAIDEVRKSSGLPLRIILGTTDRSYGLLKFMEQQGVLFDVIGYHIYPWEQHAPLDSDPWFGNGGPLGQLTRFKKPIRINEFNAGEIYSGVGGYSAKASYENKNDDAVTEAGFRSVDKHLREILNQSRANVEAVLFYEIWDEPRKAAPENRFGLYFDEELEQPKISLLLVTSFAGGKLSTAEKKELVKREIGWNVAE